MNNVQPQPRSRRAPHPRFLGSLFPLAAIIRPLVSLLQTTRYAEWMQYNAPQPGTIVAMYYGFEQHIAANRAKTAMLFFGFIFFMAALGYFVGYLIEPAFSYVLLVFCLIFAVFGTGISYWFSYKIIT
jgi:hypothetical protein